MNSLLKTSKIKSKPGVTYVQLVCYDVLYSKEPVFTIANTHMNLYGFYLVGDDLLKKGRISDDASLDELVQNGLEDNMYNSLYFPELLNQDMMPEWIQSIPLLSSMIIGNYKEVFLNKDNTLYKFDYFDLNREGKKLYNQLYEIYPEKEIRILTLIKDVF